jgi:hypothetical protein
LNYVAVKVVGDNNGERTWTYEDPSGELQVDDLVRVSWGNAIKIAIVRDTGVPKPVKLPVIKSVLAKFTAEEL